MFAAFLGISVAKPTGESGAQWESNTRFTFTAPSTAQLLRAEKETAPGSGVWNAFGSATVSAGSTTADIGTYAEAASYRIRWERQGAVSDWVTLSTPDPIVNVPSAPSAVDVNSASGVTLSGTISPSEPNCATRYQFRDNVGTVIAEATDISDGALSEMGPYFAAQTTFVSSFRARHERFSGTGAWASAWTEDFTP